jgi:hypothetical protein
MTMKFLTVQEFAPLVGLKPHTIQNMIKDGRLAPPVVVYVLGHARIDWEKFETTHITTEKPARRQGLFGRGPQPAKARSLKAV